MYKYIFVLSLYALKQEWKFAITVEFKTSIVKNKCLFNIWRVTG